MREDVRVGPAAARDTDSQAGRRWALAGVLALAGVTSIARLGSTPLWYDEIATERASGLGWAGLWRLLHTTDANLGLYYALLHLWRELGDGALWLRLPSALAGVGAVLLTERIGRRLVGRWPALIGAGLLAIHPFAVAYARDARPYALVAFACAAAALLGLRAREVPSVRRWSAYSLVSVLAVGLHLYAALVVVALAVALRPTVAGRSRWLWLSAHVPAAATTLGILAVSLHQQAQLHWVPALTLPHLVGGLSLLAGGPVVLVALTWALVELGRTRPTSPPGGLIALVVVVPVLLLTVAGLVRPTFVPRYLDATVWAQCLAIGAAATRVAGGRARVLRRAGGVLVAASLALGTTAQVLASYHYEDYRRASRTVLALARPGDGVMFADGSVALGMGFYLPRSRVSGQRLPVDVLAAPGRAWVGFTRPQLVGAAARRSVAAYARIWLVDDRPGRPRLPTALAGEHCQPIGVRAGIAVALCRA